MSRRRAHRCQDGYRRVGSPLIGPALVPCRTCRGVCRECGGDGCFHPSWIGDPVAVAESIVFAAHRGHAFEFCGGCGGVVDIAHIVLIEGDVLTAVRIGRTRVTGETTTHLAYHDGRAWQVTWLPGRQLAQYQAVTAMTIAESVAHVADLDETHRLWPHIRDWAAELDLSAAEAVAQVARFQITCLDQTEGEQP
jgi:hypothetical protein